jgi:hypothetical protein
VENFESKAGEPFSRIGDSVEAAGKDDGNDPRVGLPRKDDSTSVYYRVVARQLDSQAPTYGLPFKIVQIT